MVADEILRKLQRESVGRCPLPANHLEYFLGTESLPSQPKDCPMARRSSGRITANCAITSYFSDGSNGNYST